MDVRRGHAEGDGQRATYAHTHTLRDGKLSPRVACLMLPHHSAMSAIRTHIVKLFEKQGALTARMCEATEQARRVINCISNSINIVSIILDIMFVSNIYCILWNIVDMRFLFMVFKQYYEYILQYCWTYKIFLLFLFITHVMIWYPYPVFDPGTLFLWDMNLNQKANQTTNILIEKYKAFQTSNTLLKSGIR